MMKRTEIVHLFHTPPADGHIVNVAGWVRTARESKTLGFLEINDGSCFKNLQVIVEADKIDNFKEIANLNVGSAIIVTGRVVLTPDAKQPLEINADQIEIEGASAPDYPLQKKRHGMEFLRTIPHLRARTNMFSAVYRIRSEAAFALHQYFHKNGFVYVHTPIITGSDCEGAGSMFRVTTLEPGNDKRTETGEIDYSEDFFGRETNLTVSGQLEGETLAQAFGKIYTFGPTFRAEKSNTPRHAAEFWMLEPEMAFTDLDGNMDIAEDMIKNVIRYLLEKCPDELQFFNSFVDKGLLERLQDLADADFARITYTDAVAQLEKHNEQFEFEVYWGCDLQSEHERYLTEKIYHQPVFVTDYPKDIKAFYMRLNDDGKTVAAADMLVPGVGELVGASQREERYDVLLKRIEEMGLDLQDYEQYLDLRKYGTTKHSGFGLGFDRLLMYVTGISNIRDVQIFPRTYGGF